MAFKQIIVDVTCSKNFEGEFLRRQGKNTFLALGQKSDILRAISEEKNWRPALRSFFMEKQISFDFFLREALKTCDFTEF